MSQPKTRIEIEYNETAGGSPELIELQKEAETDVEPRFKTRSAVEPERQRTLHAFD